MSEEKESTLGKLLFGEEHSEAENKVLEYVAHRLKAGAHLRDVLEEEYVVRNTTQTQRNELLTDPRLIQRDREGLQEEFESDELKPEHPTKASKAEGDEGLQRTGPLTEIDSHTGPQSTGA